ncbi:MULTISPECIES: ABC transporter permease [Curtobacterium]|jgi:simple sugar transport system permease protein|uniref:ABC transporter permease n=1 Tax=Curtobacterium TaxID=2034 RepID=UPI000DAABCBD|nr:MULTISPECIES: ABC transporter permease [Curtobacterium]MBT1584495.1 ABC transporter permease [Curtobacterium flaccumfaciens pv. flaccumfaciens]MBT1668324.1 ABC transporter permease [Curtobacterium flaccumfaciens pv. flaccumfaciens]MCE0458222.1 ABC transporter permease [Curtobacterium allii]MCS0645577.1 ABC transporter permease [Curtobacterium flaccumfaciens pv. flaccumfaciens]MCS5505695.1 ABC transporter permease [Curtobacterium flaccumfaciens pv. flaccumfaciens]
MSTISPTAAPASPLADRPVETTRSWKLPIGYGVFTLIAIVLFGLLPRSGTTTFRLANAGDFFALPNVPLPALGTGIVVIVLLAILTVYAFIETRALRRVPLWVTSVFAVVFVIGFLTWAAAGSSLPIPGLLLGALSLSVPLVFGALGGVISERVGVVNIAIEGQFLAGAFSSAMVASITGSPWVGLVAALVAGMLVSFVLAAFSIKYLVDQVIVGVVINAFISGLTGFLYSQVLSPNEETLNIGIRFPKVEIPLLHQIPVIGPVFFEQTVVVYLAYIAVAVVTFGLFKTRWGLRLRAVGEHPQAADTVGINVTSTRFWNVSLAGAIAGLGGAYFTLDAVGPFTKDMTAGAGYIALAAVIFGRWDPIKATLAALLFGFASNLQNTLGAIDSPVPSEFLLMLPYVVTIFAVAGLVGQSRGPAASGKPYIKS